MSHALGQTQRSRSFRPGESSTEARDNEHRQWQRHSDPNSGGSGASTPDFLSPPPNTARALWNAEVCVLHASLVPVREAD